MLSPSNYHLSFTYQNNNYDIELVQDQNSDTSIEINNVKYSILTNNEQSGAIKNLFNLISAGPIASIQDLSTKIISLKDVSSVKTYSIGTKTLTQESTNDQMIKERKLAVETGLLPTIPSPNKTIQSTTIEERMNELGVPGVSIAVINNGKIEWSQGYGELNKPVLIQAASISKTITALTILSLIQQCQEAKKNGSPSGLKKDITLETDVSTLLNKDLWASIDPDKFTDGEKPKMTIRQLLSHMAGTSVEGFDGYFRLDAIEKEITELNEMISQAKQNHQNTEGLEKRLQRLKEIQPNAVDALPTTDQIIKGQGNSAQVKIVHSPGSAFQYSGGGTTILQKIIEEITDQDFETVARENVFKKIKMPHSTFKPDESVTCQGTDLDGSSVPGKWKLIPQAAGGLWTTSLDLANMTLEIQNSLQGKGFFDQKLIQDMLTPQTEDVPNGLGVFVEKTKSCDYFFHKGANMGFRSIFIGNTQAEGKAQGAIVLTNSDFGDTLHNEIITSIANTYTWASFNTLPIIPKALKPDEIDALNNSKAFDDEEWSKYTGKYSVEDHIIDVTEKDKKIYVQVDETEPFEILPITNRAALFQRYKPGPWNILRFKDLFTLELFKTDHKRVQ